MAEETRQSLRHFRLRDVRQTDDFARSARADVDDEAGTGRVPPLSRVRETAVSDTAQNRHLR